VAIQGQRRQGTRGDEEAEAARPEAGGEEADAPRALSAAMTIRTVLERHGLFAHAGNPDDVISDGDLEVEEARDLVGAY
jgi:hypothetical protein